MSENVQDIRQNYSLHYQSWKVELSAKDPILVGVKNQRDLA